LTLLPTWLRKSDFLSLSFFLKIQQWLCSLKKRLFSFFNTSSF